MNWKLNQVSDFKLFSTGYSWTKGSETLLSCKEPHAQECWGTGSHFLSLNSKASLLIWIKGVSYLPVISSESISGWTCLPPVKGEETKRSRMLFGGKEHFSPAENGVTFSLSAVTLLMWSLFFKIKSPLLTHDVFRVEKKKLFKAASKRGRTGKEKANQEKLQINFFPRKNTQHIIS